MPAPKFLIDQNIPFGVVCFLRNRKLNCKLVKDLDPEMSDVNVARLAIREKRILLTNDKDFIRLRAPKLVAIIFDFFDQGKECRNKALRSILEELEHVFEHEENNRIFIFSDY